MKKLLSFISVFALFIACLNFTDLAYAEDDFSSRAVYLCDAGSGSVILSKNEDKRLTIASMCKIMTLLLVFEDVDNGQLSLDEKITVSETASGMGGSQAFLEAGAEYSVRNLIKSVIIASANDSCVALAEKTYGSEASFVERMNERAKELGMNNTLFSNCTGLPRPTQYSCAKDVAIMFSNLIKHKEYFKFSTVRLDEIEHPKERVTGLTNTNKLISSYSGCDGGKTGYTAESGHCLAATAKRGSLRLISVVINAPDSKTRFNETVKILDYGFGNFTSKLIVDSSTPLEINAEVKGGKCESVQIIPERDYYHFGKTNEKEEYRLEFNPVQGLKAPVKAGQIVGTIKVYLNKGCVAEISCLAVNDVEKKTYFGYVYDILKNWPM